VLALLVAVGVVGWVDRNVFAVLLESVKLDLRLSDTELGLLGGAAFGVFYAAVGLPVAWLADRGNRSLLLAAALGLWSVMTAACGLAAGFASLFLARMGVGIGEAGGAPPSQSLVSDYFPPERRAFALGILYLYIPLGFLVGFALGGWLGQTLGWRLALIAVGLPGVLLAVVVRLTLREPPRGFSEGSAQPASRTAFTATLRYFLARPSLRHLPLAGAAHGLGAFAAAVWLPSYFIRVFDVGPAVAGLWMAVAFGLGGGVGVLCGGYVADWLVRRRGDERWYAWGSAAAVAASVPCAVLLYLTDHAGIAVASLLVATTFGHMFLGPVTAMMQGLAGIERRATAAAVYLLLVNLVSMGLGPVAVGLASDLLGPRFGSNALRFALLGIVSVTGIWSAAHLLRVGRTLREDLAHARTGDAARRAAR
jgi:predicted MFS family arabinose efflux permease